MQGYWPPDAIQIKNKYFLSVSFSYSTEIQRIVKIFIAILDVAIFLLKQPTNKSDIKINVSIIKLLNKRQIMYTKQAQNSGSFDIVIKIEALMLPLWF